MHKGVFDAFGWADSTSIEWVTEAGVGPTTMPSSDNPPGLGFVIRGGEGAFSFLPRERADLHLPRVPLPPNAGVLAPWAIDDATDLLYEHRVRPDDALYLATTSLAAVFWGLHDWAHFHSHGPFVEVAATELQCDLSALVWLEVNAGALGIDAPTLAAVRSSARELSAARAAAEGISLDTTCLADVRIDALVRAVSPRR